ncbi:hypothetical protein WG66_000910 [Moniliophthora roreri]|nr:hypothetical protein WG66_000910 [Moniliophthora roreri]
MNSIPQEEVGQNHKQGMGTLDPGMMEQVYTVRVQLALRVYDLYILPTPNREATPTFPNSPIYLTGTNVYLVRPKLTECLHSQFMFKEKIASILGRSRGIDVRNYSENSKDYSFPVSTLKLRFCRLFSASDVDCRVEWRIADVGCTNTTTTFTSSACAGRRGSKPYAVCLLVTFIAYVAPWNSFIASRGYRKRRRKNRTYALTVMGEVTIGRSWSMTLKWKRTLIPYWFSLVPSPLSSPHWLSNRTNGSQKISQTPQSRYSPKFPCNSTPRRHAIRMPAI